MTVEEYKSKISGVTCSVIGVGVSNLPLIDFLVSCGAKVTARDRKTRDKLEETAAHLDEIGVKSVLGEGYLDNMREQVIFRTPGMRPDNAYISSAVAGGAELTSEMETFFDLCPCTVIGITGSDGKTTTSTIIALMLREAGKTVWLGGNIGSPLLLHVPEMTPDDFCVVELSSFQLMTMRRSPDIAIVTNIAPNHLDWHTGMEEYVTAKENIFLWPDNALLVLNANDEYTESFESDARGKVVLFSSRHKLSSGVYEQDGRIYYGEEPVLNSSDILLPGWYNKDHYMAAAAALHGIVPAEVITNVARTFRGVEHRCEFVRELNGVKFYNSSIDSSPSRTAAALSAFDKKVIVICGGYDKKIPFEPLAKALCEKASTVILTGATSKKINESIEAISSPVKPEIVLSDDFDHAVRLAAGKANAGDIVLLSPGCASFDAFANFEERGKKFKDIVNSL